MKTNSIALAVMVKTPGLSPIKTRLASKIGVENALEFYKKSVKVLSLTLENLSLEFDFKPYFSDFKPYFAHAEPGASDQWNQFATCYQGEGTLGQRLDHVYSHLLKSHKAVVIIGSDLPQLSKFTLTECFNSLAKDPHSFCIGPTEDGGFYLIGGSSPIPSDVWLETPYSVPHTRDLLCKKLQGHGQIKFLKLQFDIDEWEDLIKLNANLPNLVLECPALALFNEIK